MASSDLFSVSGRSFIITGATGAMGQAAARALNAAGADLCLAGANAAGLDKLAASMSGPGRTALAPRRPETPEDAEAIVGAAIAKFGKLDGLLVSSGMNKVAPITEMALPDWEAVMDANVRGSWLMSQAAGRRMIGQGTGGSVVLVSSTRGKLGHPAGYSAYCPSKAAVDLLGKTLAAEWGKHKIRVNVIAPTVFRSELTEWMYADDANGRAVRETMFSRIPLGRFAEPEDFEGALIYLLSGASSFVTGHVLYLDGGLHGMLNAAVIGAGLMGRRIALVAARAGASVTLFDSNREVLADALAALAADHAEVSGHTNLADAVSAADFVTEAIVENLAAKQSLLEEISALTSMAILATNTSVLPVTQIAMRAKAPERVVGTHRRNLPDLIPVVEVVRGAHTSDDVMARTVAVLEGFGKKPVRVERDVPGFVGNRLQHALWREAIALVADGVCDAATVDLMARNTLGLRLGCMGPIENADYVGLDLTLAIHEAVLPSLNRDQHPSPLLREMTEAGRLGAKSGSGFLQWPAGARDRAARRLAAHVTTQLQATQQHNP